MRFKLYFLKEKRQILECMLAVGIHGYDPGKTVFIKMIKSGHQGRAFTLIDSMRYDSNPQYLADSLGFVLRTIVYDANIFARYVL